MPVTLSEAKNNALNDYDPLVIDEFRKESVILDSLTFDDAVNPAGGGATMTYGYRRLATQPTAATRAINSEYVASNVTTTPHAVNLAVMGGSFEVDTREGQYTQFIVRLPCGTVREGLGETDR